ncbi:MAG: LysM peptidoglycan-binding domain-containing protein [Planctomycetaceae bacterium]|nr:LysM peptidoglycan-binding domain-containing protein [Planctomycetaceae bacterium]
MQPIERYGLIALLFLVVTVVAVVLWDRGERRADGALVAAAGAEAANRAQAGERTDARAARAQPRSTVAQPPVTKQAHAQNAGANAPRGGAGLAALPTENLPAPGLDAQPEGGALTARNTAGPNAAGRASELQAQRAALDWILAMSDPAEQDRTLAELQSRLPENAAALAEAVRAHRALAAGDASSNVSTRSSAVVAADTNSPSPLLEVEDPRQRRPQDPANRAAPGMGLAPMEVGAANVAKVEGSTYTVQRGDTLSEISQRILGTSKRIDDIVALNPGLNPNNVPAGRVLRMPAPQSTAAPTAAVARNAPAASPSSGTATQTPGTYVVQSGDSLFRIAAKHLGDGKRHGEIAALNPKLDPNRLQPGQRLVMPAVARAAVAATAPAPASAPKPATAAQPKPSSAVASAQKPAPVSRSSSVQ